MAHKKAAGVSKNGRDSGPRYLGIKVADGSVAKTGSIIVRQAGRNIVAGKNIGVAKDHSLFALKPGTVKFTTKRKQNFDSTISRVRVAHVI